MKLFGHDTEFYEVLVIALIVVLVAMFLLHLQGVLNGFSHPLPQPSTLPPAFVTVDRGAWLETLSDIENRYAEACNRGVVRYYRGSSSARKVGGYICRPVPKTGTVMIYKDGEFLGNENVGLPWWETLDYAWRGGVVDK